MPASAFRTLVLCLALVGAACGGGKDAPAGPEAAPSLVNLAHLDHLGETVVRGDTTYRLVHIYAEAPDYAWVGDDDEGIACVDDAARAAVVYLRHVEQTGDAEARAKAEALLRFILYMQRPDGLFDNFVWDRTLRINTEHPNSRAEGVTWWTARAVWALGEGARVLHSADPAAATLYAERALRVMPHLQQLLHRYGETTTVGGRVYPRWLPGEVAADATSELLLGLTALRAVRPDSTLQSVIDRLAEGVALMQMDADHPLVPSAHLSWRALWHAWGNAQSAALVAAGHPAGAVQEAERFFPRLLVDGWLHSVDLETGTVRRFEQIAYGVRPVVTGLLALAEATGDRRYAVLAGLAASWLTGNNAAATPMYDPATGRGYDGILSPDRINANAGAESTIEALLTLQAVERHPEARAWLFARGDAPQSVERDGTVYRYRVFRAGEGRRLAVAVPSDGSPFRLLEGDALEAFLAS